MDLASMARAQQAIMSEASPRFEPSKVEILRPSLDWHFLYLRSLLFGHHFLSSPGRDAIPLIFWVLFLPKSSSNIYPWLRFGWI